MDLIFEGPFGTHLWLKNANSATVIATLLIMWGGIIALALILRGIDIQRFSPLLRRGEQ